MNKIYLHLLEKRFSLKKEESENLMSKKSTSSLGIVESCESIYRAGNIYAYDGC